MRDWERLTKMREWMRKELCEGKRFKIPVPKTGKNGVYGPDIIDFTEGEPRVFIGFQPLRPDEPGKYDPTDPYSVCPAITIMPGASLVRNTPEHRFDRYNHIIRSQDMGQSCNVQILFSIYEPGVRLPGFAHSYEEGSPDLGLLQDGTDEGLAALLNWMDDAKELLLRERSVPGTDLMLDDDNLIRALYTDQEYVVDRRPLFHGFLNVQFKGFASKGADRGTRSRIDRLLDGD